MEDKSPAEKMRAKPGMSVALPHVPEGVSAALGLPKGVTLVDEPAEADFVLEFATSQREAEERLAALRPVVTDDMLVWLAYPKGSTAAGYDLNRDTIWRYGQSVGLDFVANVSIDDTWSALRMRPTK